MTEVICGRLIVKIILGSEYLKTFLLRLGMKQECRISQHLFNIAMEILARAIRHERELNAFK